MPDFAQLALYVAAAFLLAITPGPGIYVAARTLAGGRAEGSRRASAPDLAA
jgi:threonine/homoserine/homoserine lactone efflux protein